MAKDNIYDLAISEILLRLSDSSGSNTTRLELSSSLNNPEVAENFTGNVIFTSTVVNTPIGYTVKATTHVITTPTAPFTTTGSTSVLSTVSVPVVVGAIGSTYVVSSTVTLEKAGDPDIVVTDDYTITSVSPIYYGIKAAPVGAPDSTNLGKIGSSTTKFTLVTSTLGRLYIAIPTATSGADFKGVKISPNGTWIYQSDFTQTTVGSYEYWVLNYDTILTGAYNKTFDIIYEDSVVSLPNPNPNI